MNLTTTKHVQINDFMRRYTSSGYTNPMNHIRLSADNTDEHNERVCKICCWLIKKRIPFYTEVRLTCGLRLDILVPTHVKKIIEVLHTETTMDFVKKKASKLPPKLQGEVILNHTSKPFEEKDMM